MSFVRNITWINVKNVRVLKIESHGNSYKSLIAGLAIYKHLTFFFAAKLRLLAALWSGDLAVYIELDVGQGFMEYCVTVSFDLFYKRKVTIT